MPNDTETVSVLSKRRKPGSEKSDERWATARTEVAGTAVCHRATLRPGQKVRSATRTRDPGTTPLKVTVKPDSENRFAFALD